jgi:hypothetical protein
MVVVCQRYAPAALTPGKTRYPLYRRLGWPQGQSGRKISIPLGFDPRTVQPVASRNTNCAIMVHQEIQEQKYFLGPWKWDRKVVPKRRQGISSIRWVTSQKRADLSYRFVNVTFSSTLKSKRKISPRFYEHLWFSVVQFGGHVPEFRKNLSSHLHGSFL